MRAEIIGRDGNELTIKVFDDLTDEDINRYRLGDRLFAKLELFDPESITADQRKHIYALLGDLEVYTGYPKDWWERYLKENFMHYDFMMDLPSLGVNKMNKARASKFIEFIIIFCIQNEVPFRKNQFYLTQESSNVLFYLTMSRLCVVCGQPHADIHHATNLVGMGNVRKMHNHWDSTFLSLCREHHNEVHSLGLEEFNKKYLVKPVKLNQRQLKEVGVM